MMCVTAEQFSTEQFSSLYRQLNVSFVWSLLPTHTGDQRCPQSSLPSRPLGTRRVLSGWLSEQQNRDIAPTAPPPRHTNLPAFDTRLGDRPRRPRVATLELEPTADLNCHYTTGADASNSCIQPVQCSGSGPDSRDSTLSEAFDRRSVRSVGELTKLSRFRQAFSNFVFAAQIHR